MKNQDIFPKVTMATRQTDHALLVGGHEETSAAKFSKKTLVIGQIRRLPSSKGIYEFNLAFQLRLPGKPQDTQINVDCT